MEWTPEEDEKIVKYWNAGLLSREIAAKVGNGRTKGSVLGRLNRLKQKPHSGIVRESSHKAFRAKRWTDAQLLDLMAIADLSDRKTRWSWREIAEYFHTSMLEARRTHAQIEHDLRQSEAS